MGPGGTCTVDQECFSNASCLQNACNDVGAQCLADDGSSTGVTDPNLCSAGEFFNPLTPTNSIDRAVVSE